MLCTIFIEKSLMFETAKVMFVFDIVIAPMLCYNRLVKYYEYTIRRFNYGRLDKFKMAR